MSLKDYRTSLQAHVMELETFQSSLHRVTRKKTERTVLNKSHVHINHDYLQGCLLAVNAQGLADTMRLGYEFLQVSASYASLSVRQVDARSFLEDTSHNALLQAIADWQERF